MFFISRRNQADSNGLEEAKQLCKQLTDENQNLESSMLQELSDCEAESIKGGKILYPHIVRFDSYRALAYSNTNQALANHVKLGSDKGMLVFEPSRS